MYFLLKMMVFHCYVCLPEGIILMMNTFNIICMCSRCYFCWCWTELTLRTCPNLPAWSCVVNNHGDHKSSRVVGPLPNGLYKWLINGGDPNYLQVLGAHPPSINKFSEALKRSLQAAIFQRIFQILKHDCLKKLQPPPLRQGNCTTWILMDVLCRIEVYSCEQDCCRFFLATNNQFFWGFGPLGSKVQRGTFRASRPKELVADVPWVFGPKKFLPHFGPSKAAFFKKNHGNGQREHRRWWCGRGGDFDSWKTVPWRKWLR